MDRTAPEMLALSTGALTTLYVMNPVVSVKNGTRFRVITPSARPVTAVMVEAVGLTPPFGICMKKSED